MRSHMEAAVYWCSLSSKFWAVFIQSSWVIALWIVPHGCHPLQLLGSLLRGSVVIWTSGAKKKWGYWHGGQGNGLQKWAVKGSLPFRIFLGRIFTQELADSQGWQARGPRPLHPLRTPAPGDPAAAAMVLVKAEGRTAPSSATSAWTQPRMPSSASAATSSG